MSITIRSKRNDAAGGKVATAAGVVTFDENGTADVDVAIAASLASHPSFELADENDREAINEYINSKLKTPEEYDAGPIVRARCASLAGGAIVAGNGARVVFGIDGYVLMGEKTAEALAEVLKSEFSYEAHTPEEVAETKTATKPAGAEKPLTKPQNKAAEKPAKKVTASTTKKDAKKKAESAVEPPVAPAKPDETVNVVSTEIPNRIDVGN